MVPVLVTMYGEDCHGPSTGHHVGEDCHGPSTGHNVL